MKNVKYDSMDVINLIKTKVKARQIVFVKQLAEETHLTESEIQSIIDTSSLNLENINKKTQVYVDKYFKPIFAHIQKCTENVEPININDFAEILNVSKPKVFLVLNEINFDTLAFNRKIKKTYHENILKKIHSLQKQGLLVDFTAKKLHEAVNYKYSLFTFGIFLQEVGVVLHKKVAFKDSVNSIKPFIDQKLKVDHEIRLVDIAKELNVTTQRASIILKKMNIDIKDTNKKARDEYNNQIVKKINDLSKKNLLETFSPQKLYVFLNYKFPFFTFNEMLKEKKIRLRFDMEYVDLFELFKTKGVKTKNYTVRELYDLSGIQEQMQFNSFRVKVYATKLPYKKKKV